MKILHNYKIVNSYRALGFTFNFQPSSKMSNHELLLGQWYMNLRMLKFDYNSYWFIHISVRYQQQLCIYNHRCCHRPCLSIRRCLHYKKSLQIYTEAADCGCVTDCSDYRLCCVWVTPTFMFSFLPTKTAEVLAFFCNTGVLKFVFMTKYNPS